jgi:AcrR family transcriptional regulator
MNTRERIIESGLRVARAKGFQAITLREVAFGANLTHPGVYYYFPSMAALVDACALAAIERGDSVLIGRLVAENHAAVRNMPRDKRKQYVSSLG